MKTIMEITKQWTVLRHGNLELLEKKINEALRCGWSLTGELKYQNNCWTQCVMKDDVDVE